MGAHGTSFKMWKGARLCTVAWWTRKGLRASLSNWLRHRGIDKERLKAALRPNTLRKD